MKRMFGVLLLSYAGLVGCRPRTEGRSASASRPIEMMVANDPDTLDPRYVTDTVGMRTSRLLHAGLSRVDPGSLRPIPYLAESWQWTGPLTLDVKLRKDVRFHSGAPFEAEDVVATLRALASPAVASRYAATVEPIESVRATSPFEVRIVLRRPHATLRSDLELPVLRRDQATAQPDPSGASLDGLGPFEVEGASRGEIVLRPSVFGVRGSQPAKARIAIRTVHDENARALRLYSGHADVVMNGISPTLLPALDGRAGLSLRTAPGANLTYLVVRVDRLPLSDVRLRRAISLAIDRTTLTASLFGQRARPADTLLPEGHWARPFVAAPLRYDPDQARALLRDLPSPLPRMTLLTSTERLRVTIARTMAQELADAGVDVDVVPLELGTLLARLNAGDFDLASLQLPELTEPNVLRVFLHSSYVPPMGANRGRVHDERLDACLDLGDMAVEDGARVAAYAALEARVNDQLFVIPLWHEDQVAVVSARALSFLPSPEGRWLSLADLP